MKTNVKLGLKISVATIIILIIAGYSMFQARNLIEGPKIILLSPKDGSSVNDTLSTINGKVANVSFISINDSPIFINKEGEFSQKLLLSEGYNAIKIEAKDKFGRKVEKFIRMMKN